MTIQYNMAPLQACVDEFNIVSRETAENREESLNIVRTNANNFGGQGSEAFQTAINVINAKYDEANAKLARVPIAVNEAASTMSSKDQALAGQY